MTLSDNGLIKGPITIGAHQKTIVRVRFTITATHGLIVLGAIGTRQGRRCWDFALALMLDLDIAIVVAVVGVKCTLTIVRDIVFLRLFYNISAEAELHSTKI